MSSFDSREQAFEAKFAHDHERRFKAMARRNFRLGLWAAGLLGKEGEDAEAYARSVVKSDFEEPGEEDVVRKVVADLAATDTSEADVREQMSMLLEAVMDEDE
ncbi:MAG: DUF1476 domain-containing protein [Phycisphaerales bacterium]|jgi:hypothetical protein|nr:DUF1476 domain-containing protein [Phycisphaerales bacterium]